MKILLTFQIISILCYSSKDQIHSSKSSISSKEVIEDIIPLERNPLDKIMDMPVLPPMQILISPKLVTNVNP